MGHVINVFGTQMCDVVPGLRIGPQSSPLGQKGTSLQYKLTKGRVQKHKKAGRVCQKPEAFR